MPKKCIQFISEFLIPNLNEGKFGERLKWISKKERKFQLVWHHKNGPGWSEEEAEVFVEWDKQKGHFKPNVSEYFIQSKQRFRSLLYKLTKDGQLIKEKSGNDKYKKTYTIGKKKPRRRHDSSKSDAALEASIEGDDDSYMVGDMDGNIYLEEDSANVLGDHTYSTSSNSPQNISTDNKNEKVDEINIEKHVLKERNILDDDNDSFILDNINFSGDILQDQNGDIPKISENDPDFALDKSMMEYLESISSQSSVTSSALERSLNLNMKSLLHFLYN